jgi:hypothetical protein
MMRILIATDAWEPQVNGVVRSLQHTAAALSALGCTTEFVTPAQFRTLALPSYPEIRVALASASRVETMMSDGRFDAIHIAISEAAGRRLTMTPAANSAWTPASFKLAVWSGWRRSWTS